MDWRAVLTDLRAHLPAPTSGRQVRGSLRWLEAEMLAQGANPAALRNIVYRDVGTPQDKAALRSILAELAQEVGRPLPGAVTPAPPPALPEGLELLGRSKKRAYRQFLAGVRAGRAPRLIVTGRAGAGKTVLLGGVAQALEAAGVAVRRLSLSGDAAPTLALGESRGGAYAVQAQAQADAARRAVPEAGVWLIRVTDDLHFAGEPPRDLQGRPIPAARWAVDALLERAPAGVGVLLALESRRGLDSLQHEVIELTPPTRAEARRYLMARLGVPAQEADALVRDTGRHLDRLTLLVSLRSGDPGAGHLLSDPDTRRLVEASAALHAADLGRGDQPWPGALLRAALGQEPRRLPPHARALLRGSEDAGWSPSPVLQAAWPAVSLEARQRGLERLADAEPGADPSSPADQEALLPVRLGAMALLGDWAGLAAWVGTHPDDSRHLPPLWPLIRQSAGGTERETLARAVVSHHAGRGEYTESRIRDALFTLLESSRDPVRAWARVKLAESSLEGGAMDAARSQLQHPEVASIVAARAPLDAWTVAAQADALLVEAALARWQGDLVAATRAAGDPRTAVGGPRALLWRGLIAKDAGRWQEALEALQSVPASSPLLSARARYQEGDLRLRLGQATLALGALQDAAARLLSAGAAAEERARVLARSATALRRLGRPLEAQAQLERALALVPDDPRRRLDAVPRARLLSEGLPILLALGRPDEALAQGAAALALLRRSDLRPAETAYRERRTRYRLALAYLTRGLGVPYLQPFGGPQADHPDLAQARTLLDGLIAQAPGGSDREQMLLFDMRLSRALAEPEPLRALEHAGWALEMTAHPYEEAQARAMRAEARLRSGQADAALLDINRAHALLRRVHSGPGVPGGPDAGLRPPDPGLLAQLLALEARASIQEGARTLSWLSGALGERELAPFRPGVWREAGLALERGHPDPWAVLLAFAPGHPLDDLRPPDALRVLAARAAPDH
ncbi:hypothetical protein CVO96_00400 [Deinococcus koreensis]|uniref:Uncharacterized protein n=2 Tax=Deinococcus koreensis TaxID=2054903 RepID=A0A2K3V1W9_9DEIO|nr:hypothetical protein CVO96_00400 [Deinococcus koreensis]